MHVDFDKDAYQEYIDLIKDVKEDKKARKPPTHAQLLKSIDETLKKIKNNPFYGNIIKKDRIPKETILKYGTGKLYRCELVGYWRLIYTVVGKDVEIIAVVLEYMNHDKYNKRFKYKKK